MAGVVPTGPTAEVRQTIGGVPAPPGMGKKALKRKAAEIRAADKAAKPRLSLVQDYNGGGAQNSAPANWMDERRPDGRYMYAQNGRGICFQHSKNENGCTTICDKNFEHICELCRGLHRTIHCPTNPGWRPPLEGKGRGKGRGKGKGKGAGT